MYSTGIDIGNDSIKVVTLRKKRGSILLEKAVKYNFEEFGRLKESDQKITKTGLELRKLISLHGLQTGRSVLGVSGSQIMFRYLQVPVVPMWRLKLLMNYEVSDQASKGIGECVTDYTLLNPPVLSGNLSVMIVYAKQAYIDRLMTICNTTGFDPAQIAPSASSLLNLLLHQKGKSDDVDMIVDIGSTNIDISIGDGHSLYFARSMNGGGREFTRFIQERLDVTFREAETYKTTGELPFVPEPDQKEDLEKTFRAHVSNSVTGFADSTLKFARGQIDIKDLKLNNIYLTGGAAAHPFLVEDVEKNMRVHTEVLDPLKTITTKSSDPPPPASGTYASAMGLALNMFIQDRADITLVPESVSRKREFRESGIYKYAAGVLFVLAVLLGAYNSYSRMTGLERLRAKQDTLIDNGTRRKKEFNKADTRLRKTAAEYREIRERFLSGRRLAGAVVLLEKITPPDITINHLHGGTIAPEHGQSRTCRCVRLSGEARSSLSAEDAIKKAEKYADTFSTQQIFDPENKLVITDRTFSRSGMNEDFYNINFELTLELK